MLGILIYLFFIIAGIFTGSFIFKDKDIYFRTWMGGIFANTILMAGIALTSLFFGFTHLSHIVLILLFLLPVIFIIKKSGSEAFKNIISIKGENESGITLGVFIFVILPLTILISVIMTNHILVPFENGGVASGQSTLGDLQMHLGFVTSIAEQKTFPPAYAFLNGYKLNYPFFVDMLSSGLYLFSTPLRWAILIPSYVFVYLLVEGFYIIAYRLTKRKSAAVLAVIFFFFGGGFGFSYFLDGAKADKTIFTSLFTGYYTVPTNLAEHNIRWVNPICDMIIPQRTTMAGWCMIFPALWLLLEALRTNSKKFFIILALLAGCMPMVHTHSFLALGIISAVSFFSYLSEKKDKKAYIRNWVIYGVITFIMALPQLFFWTFSQTANNDSFLRFYFNWVNEADPYLWFYLKNWGIVALFAIPAIINSKNDTKKLLIACAFIFFIAEIIVFQPNEYDNNKLIFIVYMVLLIAMCDWLIDMWHAFKAVKCRSYFAALIIISGTLSGTLSIIREYLSGGDYQTFSDDDIKISEYIKENTPSDALFLTGTSHLNPVVTLAGRNIYAGSSLYVFYHGLGDEYYTRSEEINRIYSGTYEELISFCHEKGIDYVYLGANERRDHSPNEAAFSCLEEVYSAGGETLYKVD